MAIGTTNFVDVAAWSPTRSTTRDTVTADAATARAHFTRDLNAVNREADATRAARARDADERARSDDAAASARAERDRATGRTAPEAKPVTDALADRMAAPTMFVEPKPETDTLSGSKASAPAEPVKPAAVAANPNAPGSRLESTGATRDSQATAPADAEASADGAPDGPADAAVAATTIASDDESKPGDGKTDKTGAEEAPILDAKGGELTIPTPTVAIVFGATVPPAGAPAAVPVAAGGNGTVPVDGATTKAGLRPAGVAGRSGPVGELTGEDKATSPDQAGIAAKADFLAALVDAAPTAPTAPEAAKALLGATGAAPAGTASAAAEKTATAAAPPVPLGQVPMTIGLRSLAGSSEFQIRLDPLELGRIDVTLDIDKERGTVTTHLVVERPETLAMLQRDAGSLQQALAQAGLDPSEGGINLSLSSDGGTGGETARRDEQPSRGALPGSLPDAAVAEVAPLRALRGLSGLDIRI